MKMKFTLLVFSLTLQFCQAQFKYVSPLPGSQYHNPQTNIILKTAEFLDKTSVADKNLLEIIGSVSGLHSWTARLSDDSKTVVIHPKPAFAYGETIAVTVYSKLRMTDGEQINGTNFTFKIRSEITPEEQQLYNEGRLESFIESFGYDPTKKLEEGFFEIPDSFPPFVINKNENASPGRVFYCNQYELDEDDTNSFPTIIENDGTVLWTRDEGKDGHDFKLNHNGYLSYYQYAYGWWKILDSNFNEIDSVQCGNGYEIETNGHDVQMLTDGHFLLLAFNDQTIDMTAYGGIPNAVVKGLIVQELDANRDVIFQWRSWDHFLFTDANQFTPLTNSKVDYVHGNTVERDYDNNIMISCRNMDELTKINRETGDIIWRMGGENNQFSFVNDNIPEHFRQQHDVRRIANGNITVFNNGNFLPIQISSAKEYHLDEVNKVATLVWYYEHPNVNGYKVFSKASGNAQRLPNGNTMISWGTPFFFQGIPNMTEVDVNKNIVWEMTFVEDGQKSYRTHKYDWNPCSRVSGFTMSAVPKPGGKMLLSWQPVLNAISYLVRYRPVGATTWSTKNVKVPQIKILGLQSSTIYEWNIRTVCGKAPLFASNFSDTKTFITPQKVAAVVAFSPVDFNVYPVPAGEHLTLQLNSPIDPAMVIIRNLPGQIMYEKKITGEENTTLTIDISNWPKGFYLVEVKSNHTSSTRKIIVE